MEVVVEMEKELEEVEKAEEMMWGGGGGGGKGG